MWNAAAAAEAERNRLRTCERGKRIAREILRRSFSADISEELPGKVTQVIQIFWICRSNLKRSCAHVGTHDDEGIL